MSVKVIRRFPDISKPGFEFNRWNRQFKTHNVILNGKYSNIYYPSHWTPLSMKCAFGGREFYNTRRVNYAVNDNCFLILNEGTFYDSVINSESSVESFTINFTGDFASNVLLALTKSNEYLLDNQDPERIPASCFFEQLYEHDCTSLNILNTIRYLINSPETDLNAVNENLHELLEFLFKAHCSSMVKANNLANIRYSTRIEIYKRLTNAKDYIYSNFHTKIDIDLLSRISCLSPHHFLRSFKTAFGVTPHRMLTERRITEAEQLLRTTDKSISEICSLIGFESLSSFGSLFKRYKQYSPENFRSRLNY